MRVKPFSIRLLILASEYMMRAVFARYCRKVVLHVVQKYRNLIPSWGQCDMMLSTSLKALHGCQWIATRAVCDVAD